MKSFSLTEAAIVVSRAGLFPENRRLLTRLRLHLGWLTLLDHCAFSSDVAVAVSKSATQKLPRLDWAVVPGKSSVCSGASGSEGLGGTSSSTGKQLQLMLNHHSPSAWLHRIHPLWRLWVQRVASADASSLRTSLRAIRLLTHRGTLLQLKQPHLMLVHQP